MIWTDLEYYKHDNWHKLRELSPETGQYFKKPNGDILVWTHKTFCKPTMKNAPEMTTEIEKPNFVYAGTSPLFQTSKPMVKIGSTIKLPSRRSDYNTGIPTEDFGFFCVINCNNIGCLLYTSPSPRDS